MKRSHCVRYKTEGECIQDNENDEENPKEISETSESEVEIIIVKQPNTGKGKHDQSLAYVMKFWVFMQWPKYA